MDGIDVRGTYGIRARQARPTSDSIDSHEHHVLNSALRLNKVKKPKPTPEHIRDFLRSRIAPMQDVSR